jgi:hypothetical protein
MTIQTANKVWKPLKRILKAAMKTSSKKRGDDKASTSHVRFAQSDTVYDVLALDEYTPEEIAASWFSNTESEAIHDKCKKVIHKMEKHGNNLNENKYCSRGLESMTGSRKDIKEENRKNAYNAVLDLQIVQWEQGCDDQEQIAQRYQSVSFQCQVAAICMGKNDFLAMKECVKLERQVQLRMPTRSLSTRSVSIGSAKYQATQLKVVALR